MLGFAEMAFPRATGLTFADGTGNETLVLIRDNKFVEPRGGWDVANRLYFVKELDTPIAAAQAAPSEENSTCCLYICYSLLSDCHC